MSRKSIGRRLRDFFFGKVEAKAARRQRFIQRLSLEPLEDRKLLAVRVWDGGGSDANLSDPLNWVGNAAPLPDDSLVFGAAGAAQADDRQ